MKTIIATILACAGMALGQTYNPSRDVTVYVSGPGVWALDPQIVTKADAEEIVRLLEVALNDKRRIIAYFREVTEGGSPPLGLEELYVAQKLSDRYAMEAALSKWRKRLEEMKP